jgi:hypothetical protein
MISVWYVSCSSDCFIKHDEHRVNNQNSKEVERLADQITDYLARNPLAADTLAGIESWWLSGARPNVSSSDIADAVRILLLRGRLACRLLPDGTKTYSRA